MGVSCVSSERLPDNTVKDKNWITFISRFHLERVIADTKLFERKSTVWNRANAGYKSAQKFHIHKPAKQSLGDMRFDQSITYLKQPTRHSSSRHEPSEWALMSKAYICDLNGKNRIRDLDT